MRKFLLPFRQGLRMILAFTIIAITFTLFLQCFVFKLPTARALTPVYVTNTNDTGAGSLRAAITQVNDINLSYDAIFFSIPGNAPHIISPTSPLPSITIKATLDATTETGYVAGNPVVVLDGTSAGNNANGITVGGTADHTIINGFVIDNFSGAGIYIDGEGAHNVTITNSFIGVASDGNTAAPNNNGIYIKYADNIVIGDSSSSNYSNIISGNTNNGIYAYGASADTTAINTHILNNYIGIGFSGGAVGNGTGIRLEGATGSKIGNILGNLNSQNRNIISGNSNDGILLTGNLTTTNQVMNNLIGLNSIGTAAVGNTDGIRLDGAENNILGGNISGTSNTISGNLHSGILLVNSGTTGNTVEGDEIGTNAAGTAAVANTDGVRLDGAPNNIIGGNSAGERNLISGNSSRGIFLNGSATTGNTIEGNYIGTNAAGTGAVGNQDGIEVNEAANNIIGANGSGQGNVISGNTASAIHILSISGGASNNQVSQNFIGLNAAGTAALANSLGIKIEGASSNTVGGSTISGYRNVIAGNTNQGILISGANATGNNIQGNFIGLNSAGNAAVANTTGVEINGAPNTTLGTSNFNFRNFISGNSGNGIYVHGAGATNNAAYNNQIGLDFNNMVVANGNTAIRVIGGGQLIMHANNRVRG